MVDTAASEDEGQHLQTVYPTAHQLGGPGRFGFHPEAHLTEASTLVSEENGQRLAKEWSGHWDLTKPVLLEKSPPNLVRTRFLQALFPSSSFIIVVRHPVAVAMATARRMPRGASIPELVEHWVVCHEAFRLDAPHLARLMIVPYERLVAEPEAWLARAQEFLGCAARATSEDISAESNPRYHAAFARQRDKWWSGRPLRSAVAHLESRVRDCGYSLEDLDAARPDEALAPHH